MNLLTERLTYIYEHRPNLEGENGQTGLVKASGASKSVVNQWISGKIKSIDIKYALNIERALGISHIWLMTGEGDPFDAPLRLSAARASLGEEDLNGEDDPFLSGSMKVQAGEEPHTIPIRRVKLKLRAGIAGYETEPEMEDGGVLQMPRKVIERNNYVPHQLLAVPVRGCSMEPMFFEDDIVVINTADKKPVDRELFAVNFNGEACIKQLCKNGKDWFLRSFHPEHGPVNVRSGQCEIVGRVVYQPGRELSGRL